MHDPILILGGTGGIGAALARRLVASGRAVHLCGRDPAKLKHLGQEIGADWSEIGLRDPQRMEQVIEEAAPEGRLGGLAYCVGSIVLKPLRQARASDFAEAFELNLIGAAECLRLAEKPLRAGQGAVVLFSTVAATQGFPNHSVIAAAKGAVEGFARSLAAEWSPEVRVNCVAPSLTRTPLAEPLLRSEQMERSIAQLHPLGRLGEPEDAAALAAFLLSPDSGWITGQIVGVDGGRGALRTKG
jgi:NAD(P)-dependent dehydrogenase (short-subunit alcohol dehydrogenase family)